MGKFTSSIEVVIDRPVQDVWDYISDPSNLPEWLSDISDIQKSADTMSVGATYSFKRRFLGRQMDGTTTVDAFEPPKQYAYNFTSGELKARVNYDLAPLGSGTILTFGIDADVGGFFGIGPAAVQKRGVGAYTKDLDKLKEVLNGPTYGHKVDLPGSEGTSDSPA